MIPIIITLAKALGWDPVSLALPAALCIDCQRVKGRR